MSLYNMVHGMNASLVVFVSPFLPIPADSFPRFRDVFLSADDTAIQGDIYVYTRMGGGNRECWETCSEATPCPACEAHQLEASPQCVGRYDDSFDSTYSTLVFRVPAEMKADWEHLQQREWGRLSEAYWKRLREQFAERPKVLAFIDKLVTAAEAAKETR